MNREFKISLLPSKPKSLDECKTIIDTLKYYGAIQISKDNMMMDNCYLKFNECPNVFVIDIISVAPEYRGQGYGKQAMEALVECSNLMNKPLILTVGNVTKQSFSLTSNVSDLAGYNASLNKNKIPVKKLQSFYESFGFVKYGIEKQHAMMKYIPNKL